MGGADLLHRERRWSMATDLRIEADNRVGQLATLSEELGKVGVNIDGFCATVADGRGVLHVLVEDPGTARQALVGAGYIIAAEREALVLEDVEDRPGYLGEMARRLADNDVNIEVGYLATNTRVVFVVPDVTAARQAL
jgi:hypothetical protein